MAIEYISKQHRIGDRSIPKKKLTSGVISTTEACYWVKGNRAAIFNYSVPYTRYYINGIETDTPTIAKGDSFIDADCYSEGIEGTLQMLMFCQGYYDGFGVRMSIKSTCGKCDNDLIIECTVTSTHRAIVENSSGIPAYEWNITYGTIISGEGTAVIVVETVGIYSVKFDVSCTVTDKYTSATDIEECIHYRQQYDPGYSILVPHIALYPQTNLIPIGA